MNINFFITLAAVLLCFIAPAIMYNSVAKNNSVFNSFQSIKRSSFMPIYITLAFALIVGYLVLYNPSTFIFSLTNIEIFVPLTGALTIYLSGYNTRLSKLTLPFIFSWAIAAVLVMPEEAMLFIPMLPSWLNRIILIAVWFIFSCIYRYSNSGDEMLAVQSISLGIGIALLMILDALPYLLGLYGFAYVAAFMALLAFTWYPSRIKISTNAASSFGFMLFGLISYAVAEGCGPCILIFCMYMIVDFLWALGYKLTFQDRYNNLIDNTCYRQAVEEGMHPIKAVSFTIRIHMLLIFFGCFQIYSPNQMSLVILSIFLTIWFCYKFKNIPTPVQHLKDINTQVLEELQDRVEEFKKIMSQNNKDD
jgi:hypothetical protein